MKCCQFFGSYSMLFPIHTFQNKQLSYKAWGKIEQGKKGRIIEGKGKEKGKMRNKEEKT
mgnify:CR=1 FL=1